MATPRNFFKMGHNGPSLAKVWMGLLCVALVVVLIDFRFLWRQMDRPVSSEHVSLTERLRDGYSRTRPDFPTHSLVDQRGLPPSPSLLQDQDLEKVPLDMLEDSDQGLQYTPSPNKPPTKELPRDGDPGGGVGGGGGGAMLANIHETADEWIRYVQNLKVKPHDKWIVLDVTSVKVKCGANLSPPSGWRILATGKTDTLKGCSPPGCQYIRPPRSEDTNTPPLRKFSINLVYLTAIYSQAKVIVDADCTVPLNTTIHRLKFSSRRERGAMYNRTLLFNAYTHFGAWATRPRALHTENRLHSNSRMYFVRDFDGNVLVKHGFSDISMDMVNPYLSEIFHRNWPGYGFDESSPPVFVGQKSFSLAIPVSSQYKPGAFWGLHLPCQSTMNLHCSMMRLLIQQRLFRDIDAFSGLYQIKAEQYVYTSDVLGHSTVMKLVNIFHSWTCQNRSSLFSCFSSLADHLFQKGVLHPEEHFFTKVWIQALITLNITTPGLVSSPWRGVRKTGEVRVVLGSTKQRLEEGAGREENVLKAEFANKIKQRCGRSNWDDEWFPLAQWKKPGIDDVVLIVVFNTNLFFWHNLPYTETMHRPYFQHIVYCVRDVNELLVADTNNTLRHVTFVEGLSDSWYLMYECLTNTVRLNIQGVRGYIQIGDDTLTNTWKYFNAPRDSVWMPHGFTTMRAASLVHGWDWYWWRKSRGRAAAIQTLAELEQISGMTSEQLLKLNPNYAKIKASQHPVTSFSELYRTGKRTFPRMRLPLAGSDAWESPTREEAVKFLTNYYKEHRMSGQLKHRALDLFYIPQVLADAWVTFSQHFMKRNVIIEMAVPALHYGLTTRSEVSYVRSSSVWRENRNAAFTFYDESLFFLHPFKMKGDMDRDNSRDFFCNTYLKTLFSQLANHTKT